MFYCEAKFWGALAARELSDYLAGLTGKYTLACIAERSDLVILYLGEGQGRVEFNCKPGLVEGWASTSLMGPGFHQTVVELLEKIQQKSRAELAQHYFLWFHAGKDAYYYRNAALFDLWNSRWKERSRPFFGC